MFFNIVVTLLFVDILAFIVAWTAPPAPENLVWRKNVLMGAFYVGVVLLGCTVSAFIDGV